MTAAHLFEAAESAVEEWQTAWGAAAGEYPDQVSEIHCQFAGAGVRVRIVGERLANHTRRAFAHLEVAVPRDCSLRIDLWDECATGVALPPRGISLAAGFAIGSSTVAIEGGGRFVRFDRGPDSSTLLDRGGAAMIGWRRDGGRMSFAEYSKPLSIALRVWYYDRDVDVIHAAAVARNGSGVLIGGFSGAGKSTTALACLAAGFDCLGDDEVGLQEDEVGSFVAHSIYNSVRLRPGGEQPIDLSRDLAAARRDPETGKSLHFLSEIAARPIPTRAAIRAAVFPRIVNQRPCSIVPISPRAALMRLGAASLFGPLGFGERAFGRLKHLFAGVPAYELQLGRDWATAPDCIDRVLAEVDA